MNENDRVLTRREMKTEGRDEKKVEKRDKALRLLVAYGILQPLKGICHGRKNDNSNWQVEPNFDNSQNTNFNGMPVLHTSDYDTAENFAEARSLYPGEGVVYEITSEDPDATIIDPDALLRLSGRDRENAIQAISSTLIKPIFAGAPLEYQARDDFNSLKLKYFKNKHGLMFESNIEQIQEKTGLDESIIRHVGSILNTKKLISSGSYLNLICGAFLTNHSGININVALDNGEIATRPVPINHEYLANWFRTCGIVGCKMRVFSATLGEDIDDYLLFDLKKVNTPEAIAQKDRTRNRLFGKLVLALTSKEKTTDSSLMQALESDLYIKPQDIVGIAKKTPGFKEIFEADAGNWEKYTLEQHTETVLRIFDNNYADDMPSQFLPIMRLVLLTHDIGKPKAVENHDKPNQIVYNKKYADKFMTMNNIDENTKNLVIAIIGDGMRLASQLYVWHEPAARESLRQFCENCIRNYFGINEVSPEIVDGFQAMMRVLQTCDSAAYTSMAVTRMDNGVWYHNFPSFNDTFDAFYKYYKFYDNGDNHLTSQDVPLLEEL